MTYQVNMQKLLVLRTFNKILRKTYSSLVVSDPFLHYQSLVSIDHFRKDDCQLRAVKELQKLYRRIDNYEPPIDFARKIKQVEKLLRNQASTSTVRKFLSNANDKSLVRQLSWEDELLNVDSPRGLMLSGSVGTGKSMLIDLLLPMKKRWHYNAFMLELFARLHRERDDEYVLLKIAYELIEESPILAIDEFQLGDPAAARIMKGVLIYFWKMGGVLVATSNRMPEDLYSGSFQAEQFKSFTELLSTRCVVHDMRSDRDFRREVEDQLTFYHAPGHGTGSLETTAQELLPSSTPHHLTVYSRVLQIPVQDLTRGVARFTFSQLCNSDLGPADYISIASTYQTLIINTVPILTLNKKNEARRFISLIDALYEAKCKLLIEADAIPEHLFFPDLNPGSASAVEAEMSSIASESFSETFYDVTTPNRPNVSAYTPTPAPSTATSSSPISSSSAALRNSGTIQDRAQPALDPRRDFGKLSAFTGQDEQFAFKRASSRLHELTSREWWTKSAHAATPDHERGWERSSARPLSGLYNRDPSTSTSTQVTMEDGTSLDSTRTPASRRGSSGDAVVNGQSHGSGVERMWRSGSPFRKHPDPPPKFGMHHFWAMITRGGKRAPTNPKDWEKKE